MAIIKRSQVYTQTVPVDNLFSDVTTEFSIHPQKLDLFLDINENAVKRSIRNILLTNNGERLFNPTLGSSIRGLLFENFSPQTENALKSYIEVAIENHEPRANLIDVVVAALPDENTYAITIVFSIINSSDPIVLDFLLNRTR